MARNDAVSTKHFSEIELASAVVDWLEARGYDVFQEVELRAQGPRADIVARRGPELTIVEVKVTASLALLYQAMERRRLAHRIYVAVPRAVRAMIDVYEELGIGVLVVRSYDPCYGTDVSSVEEVAPSRRWNSRPLKLASRLREEHKTSAPAGSRGGHWSRWRDTCARITRLAASIPGIALKEALQQVSHHYASDRIAVTAMADHISAGRVPGLRLDAGCLWCDALDEAPR